MSTTHLETAIEAAWEARDTITPATKGETRDAIEATLHALDHGQLRVADRGEDGTWHVNQWAKKGGSSGLPPAGHGGSDRRAAGRHMVGQGRQQVRPLG